MYAELRCGAATVDMIPAVMTDVVRLLKHERELVRKKALMVLHRMNQLDPDVRWKHSRIALIVCVCVPPLFTESWDSHIDYTIYLCVLHGLFHSFFFFFSISHFFSLDREMPYRRPLVDRVGS